MMMNDFMRLASNNYGRAYYGSVWYPRLTVICSVIAILTFQIEVVDSFGTLDQSSKYIPVNVTERKPLLSNVILSVINHRTVPEQDNSVNGTMPLTSMSLQRNNAVVGNFVAAQHGWP